MRRAILAAVFLFSVCLNVAGFAALGRHWWLHDRENLLTASGEPSGWRRWLHEKKHALQESDSIQLTRDDRKTIRKLWSDTHPEQLQEIKQKTKEKLVEILNLLDSPSPDEKALSVAISDLAALKTRKETETMTHLQRVSAKLPPEKRHAFLSHLRDRIQAEGELGVSSDRRTMGKPKEPHPGRN